MTAVHVLGRIHSRTDARGGQPPRQGKLNEDTMALGIRIERTDQGEEVTFVRVRRWDDCPGEEAKPRAAFSFWQA